MVQGPQPGFFVQIESDPPGALVELDGVPRGRTPLRIPGVSRGSHAVRLRLEGYRDLIRGVRVDGDRGERYTLAPVGASAVAPGPPAAVPPPAPPAQHRLTLESEPPGAAVFRGSQYLGNTPLFFGE